MKRKKDILLTWVATSFVILSMFSGSARAGIINHKKAPPPTPLELPEAPAAAPTAGSLWSPQGLFNDLATDYKAHGLNDLVTIDIVEQTTGSAAGTVDSERQTAANSGVSGLIGQLGATNRLQNLLGATSSMALTGKGSATTATTLNTQVTGRVVQVLKNGTLVVEARRDVEINHEKQTVILRCLVRPGDITPENSVLSTQVSDLSVAVDGKGVVSDATRPPTSLVRLLFHLFMF